MIRIGHGYDVHRFAEPQTETAEIILGGVTIAHTRVLIAHSDGDVLLHALADALLGAIAAGDIGQHFPDTDPKYSGASSRLLLRHVNNLINEAGFSVINVDSTIIAQRPKMAPYIPEMIANIAADLAINKTQVNVKATTTEGLGFSGREEGIAVHAVCLLSQILD